MSIANLLITDTFRTWFNLTNDIIDELNNTTLVAGETVFGAFTLGTASNTSFNIIGSLNVNSTAIVASSNTTFNANVVVSSSANLFNIAAKTLLLQSVTATIINASPLTVNANATFLGPVSVNNDVTISGNTSSNNFVLSGLANVAGPLNARQVLFTMSGSICSPAALTNPEYDDFLPSGLNECEILNLSPSIDAVITGLSAPNNVPSGGRILYIQNISTTNNLTFVSANTNSGVNNRFKFPNDTPELVPPGGCLAVLWTSANKEWRSIVPQGVVFTSLTVSGLTTLNGNTIVGGWLNVANQLVVSGNAAITGNLTQTGNATFAGFITASSLQITGLSTLTGNVTMAGFANVGTTLQVGGALSVGGNSALTGNVTISGFANVVTSLQVGGTTILNGGVGINLLGNVSYPQVAKTGTYTITVNDDAIWANGTFTVTLYTAVGNSGRRVTVKNTNTGVVTMKGNGTEKIDASNTLNLTQQYQAITVESDGTQWWVI